MYFSYDVYGKLKQTKLILANPQKNKIGLLHGITQLKFKPYFNSISELSFRIYKEADGIQNKYYNRIVEGKLIEMMYVAWFQIKNIKETHDQNNQIPYKEVICLSLENELIYKGISNLEGVYSLNDVTDPEYSLMHIMSSSCNWRSGHIDTTLLSKYRTLSIDNGRIYNLFSTDFAKSFDCIFQWDTYEKTVNAYKLSNIGSLTNIIISDKNILREYVKESDLDKIVTKMRVIGGQNSDGTQFDIRSVNFGFDYIVNIDYYLTTEWMSQGLIDAWNTYKTKQVNYHSSYTNAINQLKTYNSELLTLNTQLTDLQSNYEAQVDVYSAITTTLGRVPIPSDNLYNQYQTALSSANSYLTQIASKNNEIANKKSQISSVQASLDNISTDLTLEGNFTQAQLVELDSFLLEGDVYEDSSFLATETMSETEIIDMKLELLANATAELARASRPQYTFSTTIANLFTLIDDLDQKISFDVWKSQFVCGNIITLKFRDDYAVQVRIMSMEFNFEDFENIEVTFSDKNRLDDELVQLAEILAQSSRTSSSYSLGKYGYDKSSRQANEVAEFISGTFLATKNKMANNDNQELLIDTYGLHMRKWLPDQNKYSDYGSWWNNYNLLFTSDNWQSSSTAIGLLTAPDGNTYYGIATDVIVGNFILGSKLNITNSSGSYIINNNGFTATATIGTNTYQVGINPSTPDSIINVKINGINKFYIDTITNELKFDGKLGANSINADMINALNIVAGSVKSSWVYTGNISAEQITSGFISADRITGGYLKGVLIDLDFGTGSKVQIISSQLSISSSYGSTIVTDISVNTTTLNCSYINGYVPITSNNISEQSVSTATYANTAGTASSATYATSAGSAGYATSAGSAPLSSGWAYAIKTNVGFLASQIGASLPASWPS